MPTYQYRCEEGHEFEVFHGIKDESPRTCPTCDRPAKRVPAGGSGLLFKGSGFYITDYRSASYKEGSKKDSGTSPGTSSGSGGSAASGSGPAPKPSGE